MRLNAFTFVVVVMLAVFAAGCVSTLDNRKEAGNPFVKDQIVNVYERPVMQCWDASKQVLAADGVIFGEDVMQSTISARVDTRTVRVKVESMDPKMTRITVQVRTKAGNSDLALAGQIDKQIALLLATGLVPVSLPATSPAK